MEQNVVIQILLNIIKCAILIAIAKIIIIKWCYAQRSRIYVHDDLDSVLRAAGGVPATLLGPHPVPPPGPWTSSWWGTGEDRTDTLSTPRHKRTSLEPWE